jgi:hypothetical protein
VTPPATPPDRAPREEILATLGIGPAGAILLYRLVGVVARARNFPPPPGYGQWDHSAITETAHDFLDGERGRKRVIDIAIRSVDDRGFQRLMERAVVNHLRDASRRSDLGRLVRRVSEVLAEEGGFTRVGAEDAGRWSLKDGPAEPSPAPEAALIAAVAPVPVTVPGWTSERRWAPLADRESFRAMISAILGAAGGSLTAAQITRVIATRIDHHRTPLSIELDVLEGAAERAPRLDPAVAASSAIRAAEIFGGLSENERIMVACFELPVRDLTTVLPLGKSQAALLRQRLATRLQEALWDDEEAAGTVEELRRLCERWIAAQNLTGNIPDKRPG